MVMIVVTAVLNILKEVKIVVNVQILLVAIFISVFQIRSPLLTYNSVGFGFTAAGFNVVMVILSIWIRMLILLVSLKYNLLNQSSKLFNILILVLLGIVTLFFITDRMLVFYIAFEASLLPTLILILKWGYQPERLQARFYFVMYTICASLPLLVMLLKIKTMLYSYRLEPLQPMRLPGLEFNFSLSYLAIMMAFLVKVPM